MIAGAQEPIKLLPYNSMKNFNLKGRARQIYIEVPYPRTYVAIEAIQPEIRKTPPFEPTCKILPGIVCMTVCIGFISIVVISITGYIG